MVDIKNIVTGIPTISEIPINRATPLLQLLGKFAMKKKKIIQLITKAIGIL